MYVIFSQVKKHQQRVLMILDSKNIEYIVVDITEPGKENEKEFMQQNSKAKEAKYPLPPQIFNGDDYCGVSLTLKPMCV
jgi:glutaredoxin